VSNKPQKKILSVVYDWNKDEPKTWQTLLTKDTHQERGSGGENKSCKTCRGLQPKYNYNIHTCMHYFSFPKSNPNQPNGFKVFHNPNKKIIIFKKNLLLFWTKQR